MRVLILSCNTGEGHNSCGKAIKEVYDARGDDCVMEDSLRFISQRFSKFISWGHSTVYRRLPGLFRYGYDYSERHPAAFYEGTAVYRILTGGTARLHDYIVDHQYDAVICVHPFSALQLTAMQKEYHLNMQTCFVATDYTCSPMVQESNLDYYFIPDPLLAEEFLSANIPKEKVVASGLPIRQGFYRKTDIAAAKEQFDVSGTHPHLLMMCGSMACGPMDQLTKQLLKRVEADCEITIACGSNEKLRRKLEKKYQDNANVHIRGFVKDMATLMDSADLYLTKPGGLSVTEAAGKNLPMVFIDAVAGCEAYNCQFFVELGGAKTGNSAKELADLCVELLKDPEQRAHMSEMLAKREKPNAAERIYAVMRSAS